MILVTGAQGAIGNVFCKKILDNDYKIIPYDLPDYNILKINHWTNFQDLKAVVHFAAMANLNESIADQDKNFEVNIRGTYEVAKFCVINKVPLIFISTCCVFGNSGDKIETEDRTIPSTVEPYACSKMAGEYILRGMPELDYTILRIGTVYGNGMRKELFNYIAFDKNIKDEPININGDGTQTRNYIYIDDLVNGIYLATTNFEKVKGQVINLCGSESTSIMQTLKTVEEITGRKYNMVNILGQNRYGEIQEENISIEKAEKLLGWKPVVNYEDGMRMTYEWMKKNG